MQPEQPLTHADAKTRAARSIVSVFGRHALVRLLGFLGTLVIARLIAPESFGLFVTAQFMLNVLQTVAVGGITTAIVWRHDAVDEEDYRTAFTMQQCLTVVAVIAFWLAAPFVTAAYGLPPERAVIFQVMALAIFPISLRSISLAVLQRGLRYDLAAITEVAEYVVYVVIAIGLAWLGFDVWALVAAAICRQIVGAALMQRLARAHLRFGFSRDRARALLGKAIPLQAQMLLDLGQRSMIPVVVGLLLGVTAVGISNMANTIVEVVALQPLFMLSGVQFRMFARVQDSAGQMRRLLENGYSANAMVFLPAFIFVGIFAPAAVPVLLSQAWSDVGPLVSGLAAASALHVVASPNIQAAKALGELRSLLIAGLLNLAMQLICLVAAAPFLGLLAYPLAVAAGVLTGGIYIFRKLHRRLGMALMRPILPILVANLAAGGIWIGAVLLSLSLWLTLAAIVLGGIVYVALLVLLARQHLGRLLRFAAQTGPRKWRRVADRLGIWLGQEDKPVGGGENAR